MSKKMIDHPITPPPELLQQWIQQGRNCIIELDALKAFATQVARWGADQELEECCKYITGQGKWFATPEFRLAELRAARRPKPPSVSERLRQVEDLAADAMAALRYIEHWHGRLSGVGWARLHEKATRLDPLTRPPLASGETSTHGESNV
jgi:hypothetical protein